MNPALLARYIWLFAFCYVIVAALVFQKFLLPALPALHGGQGLLMNDATLYHQVAVSIATNIREQGWSAWSILSTETNTTGNVAVLAALYAIFQFDPALIIPVNAFLQATSALLLFLICRELWPARIGVVTGVIVATLFVCFPTGISWYGQPLKEPFLMTGVFLLVYGWLRAWNASAGVMGALVPSCGGLLLIAFVKPYYLRLHLVVMALVLLGMLLGWMAGKRKQVRIFLIFALTFLFAIVLLLSTGASRPGSGMQYEEWQAGEYVQSSVSSKVQVSANKISPWKWEPTTGVPDVIEKYFEVGAKTRAGLIEYNRQVGANTTIDADNAPNKVLGVLLYLPRALQIGLFAPMPDTWFEREGLTKAVAVAETVIWYCIFPGLFLVLYFARTKPILTVIAFSIYFITVLSFVTPNVGSLYRYRFLFEFLLMSVAIGGWLTLLSRKFAILDKWPSFSAATDSPPAPDVVNEAEKPRGHVIGSGFAVSIMTLIVSLGFFGRDLLLARWFGAGHQVDAFFLGQMIPMFVVAVLAMPAGATLIPNYCAIRQREGGEAARKSAANLTVQLTALMVFIASLIYMMTQYLHWIPGFSFPPEQMANIEVVTNIYLLMMVLGAWIIVASAILNAEGSMLLPTLAQLSVPVIAIAAMWVSGAAHGLYPVVYGMLLGQIVHLAIVSHALARRRLWPVFDRRSIASLGKAPLRQYLLLAAAALFTALSIPVANTLALRMGPGGISVVGIGVKAALLVTGVIGAGLTTILLPYFSGLVAKHRHGQARSDFSFFLLLVTLIVVPLAVLLILMTEPVIKALFWGSEFSEMDLSSLITVTQFGLVQLPFFACGLVAIKYITAYGKSGMILLSSVAGLLITWILGDFLSKNMGVGGIALAMSISMAISSAMLVFYINHLRHLSVVDSIFIAFNWLIFISTVMCWRYQLYVGVGVSLVAYLLLVLGNWYALFVEWRTTGRVSPAQT